MNAIAPLPPSALPEPPKLAEGLVKSFLAFRADPLALAMRMRAEVGDVAQMRIGPENPVFVFAPDGIKRVLVDNFANYDKQTRGYDLLRRSLGNGLLTSEGDFWRRQRRIAQPAFHKQRLAQLAQVMQRSAVEQADAWQAPAASAEAVDVAAEMMQLALKIAGLTLFGVDLSDEGDAVSRAINEMMASFRLRIASMLPFAEYWPTPANLRARRSLGELDRVVFQIIEQRRRSRSPALDLLGMLMDARDEDTGERMTDAQLRDEVVTMLTAGHETTANALSWTFYLLSAHPDVARRVEAEIDGALGGAAPGPADLPKLAYTEQVLLESMRLFPPAWIMGRRAVADDAIGGYRIAAGRLVFVSPFVTHRHPALWENPEGFDPDRFAPERVKERDKHAYLPFASGPRKCIGDHFARMEAMIVLATLLSRYRVELTPGQMVVPEPSVTLRPRHGIKMLLRPRRFAALAAE